MDSSSNIGTSTLTQNSSMLPWWIILIITFVSILVAAGCITIVVLYLRHRERNNAKTFTKELIIKQI